MALKIDQRDYRFDYLRCIAIIGIVICHYLVLWPETKQIGRLCAMTFNNLFVLISAMLIGMKYMGRCNASFLKKRLCKLSFSYYPFVFAIIIIGLFSGFSFDWKDLFRILIYFNPATLPGCGHLWFVMMILFAYVLFYLFNYLNTLIGGGRKHIFLVLFVAALLVLFIPLNYFLIGRVSFYYGILFLLEACFANELMNSLFRMKHVSWLLVLSLPISFWLYQNNIYETNNDTALLLGLVNAVLIASVFLSSTKLQFNKWVSLISTFSFEIYLVHHPFVLGEFSLHRFIDNPTLLFFIYILLTTLCALALRRIALYIGRCIDNHA